MIGRRSHDDAQAFDQAWCAGTSSDENIAALIGVAEQLCQSAATTEPSAEFRTSLRSRLMTEAATVLVPPPPTPRAVAPARAEVRRPVRRRVATITAALITSAGAVGIVASSATAVPGDMLYSVKRSVESVELQLHRDDASRGAYQLSQASERLAEARQLSADGQPTALIADTLDDFSSSAASGSSNLFSDYTSTGQEKSIRQVNDFAAESSVNLSALSSELPEGLTDSFTAATEAVTDLATEASSLCGSCAPADVQALVSSVSDLTELAAPPSKAPVRKSSDEPSTPAAPGPSDSGPPSSRPSSSPPSSAPTTPPPTVATTDPPPLSTLTDPLLGGLLGSDDQVGLIPGVLNGLLGTPPK